MRSDRQTDRQISGEVKSMEGLLLMGLTLSSFTRFINNNFVNTVLGG